PTTVSRRAVVLAGGSNRMRRAARWIRCGQGLTEREFRSPSADRERWQRRLDRCWRGWVTSPNSKDPDHELWPKQSRRHAQEPRSVPGPSELAATPLDCLFLSLVLQGSTETDLCGRKNKHRPCRALSAARFPWIQRSRRAAPNPTRGLMRAT